MKRLQRSIEAFSKERGWTDGALPGDYIKSILIEAAELLELFQWKHPTVQEVRSNQELLSKVEGELADVFIYAINLANILDLDAAAVIRKKMKANARKYPVAALKADPENYYRLKEEYRRKSVNDRPVSRGTGLYTMHTTALVMA